ncbi:MAG: aminoacetone oxidase family FAD-binding enzyme [Candidatus Pacebacteria bacterium]|nr:aminoacetone oxidase family FAD-binding enzyme [Candidatus Paceibacterota bacterium]
MMAAGRAAQLGKKVLLLEKNTTLGKKLKISGGGRCNITNAEEDMHALLKYYGNSAQFLYSTFAQFNNKDTFNFFEKLNLPLVVQAHKRVFPHTEKAFDVFTILERYLKDGSVVVRSNSKVSRILKEDKLVVGVISGDVTYTATSYILATGGLSHPETGSTGDGFNWLKALGHSINTPTPTIVPLATKESWGHLISGVSLDSMKINFFVERNGLKQKVFSKTGSILFTHFGISGPLILNSAKKVADLLHDGIVTAQIDVFAGINSKILEEKIISVFDANKNKIIKNIVGEIVPAGMTSAMWLLFPSIDPNTKVHSITKEQRKLLVEKLKALPLTISGLMGYDRAVVADGGVPLLEMDTKTMRSKILDNLFITGDLLHVNRPSGGFSLQLCWTTGFVAGTHA